MILAMRPRSILTWQEELWRYRLGQEQPWCCRLLFIGSGYTALLCA